MTTVDQVRDVLHAFAGYLVWPVLVGLLVLAALVVISAGAFTREAWDRTRNRYRKLEADRRQLDAIGDAGGQEEYHLHLEQALQHAVRRRWRDVNRLRIAVRLGPSLGLMGTLIPMADALQGLAEGNLPALASNMVTAFAATVVGLSISVVAYLLAAARENWVRADAEALAFHAERLSRSGRHSRFREVASR